MIELESDARAEVARRKEDFERTLHALEEKAHEGAERVQHAADRVKDAAEDVREKVERSPWLFMAASLGVGIGIGRLIGLRAQRSDQRLLAAGEVLRDAGPLVVVQEEERPSIMGSALRILGGLALRAATFAIAAAAERAIAKATERMG